MSDYRSDYDDEEEFYDLVDQIVIDDLRDLMKPIMDAWARQQSRRIDVEAGLKKVMDQARQRGLL